MKHHVVLKPMKGSKGGWFSGNAIKANGIEYTLLKNLQAVHRAQLKAGDEILNTRIAPDVPFFNFNYEDSGGDAKNELRKHFAEIIKYHPQVYTEGFKNPNAGAAVLYELEDLAMNDARNFEMEALTLAAKNKAWNMSYREKIDAYYYYGENPMVSSVEGLTLMDNKQLTIRLCGDGIGLVMRRILFGNTGKTYLEHFVKEYKKGDENYILRTIILKAFILKDGEGKVLLQRKGSAILLGEDIIGSNIEEAAGWLNNNPERKKFLAKMVAQSDTIDADNIDEAIQTDDTTVLLEKKATEKEIRDEAQKLKVVGYYNYPIDKLLPEIEKAKEIWKQVENMGLLAKVNAMKKPNLQEIAKLVEGEKARLLELA